MSLRRLVIVACLLGATACKKDDPPAPEAEQSPAAERRRECERFATDMARTGLIAGQMLVTALDDDPESASRGRDEMKQDAHRLRRELFDKCMEWPDEVMQCLPPLGILKEGCEERLLAAMDDAKPPPEHVTPGPTPAWTLTLEHEPRHVAVANDGTVLVVGDGLMGVRDGKVAWHKPGDFDGWLLPLPGEPSTWATGLEERLVAFDPVGGDERWSATLPPIEGDEELGEPERSADVQVAVRAGEGLVVGDAAARFFRIDPARCADSAAQKPRTGACITAEGRLPDEILDSEARLFVDGADGRYLWEDGVLRGFAPTRRPPTAAAALAEAWRPRMTARAHDALSSVTVADGRLVLVVDHDVVELDPTQCRGEATFGPSGWPQPGALVVREADECDECRPPPPGCRRWRVYLDDVTSEAPALLHDGAVVVHAGGYTLALHQGETRWKASTGGGGPLVTDGTRVFGFSTGLREGDPPGLFEVAAADGTLRWRSVLPVEVGEIYFSDDIRLALGGAWLVAAYEQTLMALPLPPV
jgi:outer membrane protein assembly factor BamB